MIAIVYGKDRNEYQTEKGSKSPTGNSVNTVTFDDIASTAVGFTFQNASKKFAVAVVELKLF